MKIIIGEACDSVTYMIVDDDGVPKSFYFNQEDTKEGMVEFFKALGIEAVYEEWY